MEERQEQAEQRHGKPSKLEEGYPRLYEGAYLIAKAGLPAIAGAVVGMYSEGSLSGAAVGSLVFISLIGLPLASGESREYG